MERTTVVRHGGDEVRRETDAIRISDAADSCNDLWLQLMTVSLCDGLIRRMHVGRERENSAHERGRAYFARPSRVSQLSLALGHVSLPLITYSSPLCLSMTRSEPGISTVLIGSFFVANTTTRHDYAESLQWFRTALDEEQRHPRYASRSTLYVISFRAFEHRHLPLSLCHLYYGDLP